MLIDKKSNIKGPKDAVSLKIQADSVLADDDLDRVTGGTGQNYSYWFPDGSTDNQFCLNGEAHLWVKSPGGNFEYCSKCHAERYFK